MKILVLATPRQRQVCLLWEDFFKDQVNIQCDCHSPTEGTGSRTGDQVLLNRLDLPASGQVPKYSCWRLKLSIR